MTDRTSIAEYHDRIAALAPALRERAGEAEKIRRLSQQTIDELDAVGLIRVFQPAGYGGPELSMAEVLPMLCLDITGPALGAAYTATEVFINHIENRNLPFSIHKQIDSAQAHRLLGEVMMQTGSAELMLDRGAALVRDRAEAGQQMPLVERNLVCAYSSGAVRQCIAAIESLFLAAADPALPFENPILEQAVETWNGEWWKYGGGGTAWDAISYDPELNLVYIGVGNGTPWNQRLRSPGGGDNLFLASIVALNADTGEYVWHYQTAPGGHNWHPMAYHPGTGLVYIPAQDLPWVYKEVEEFEFSKVTVNSGLDPIIAPTFSHIPRGRQNGILSL